MARLPRAEPQVEKLTWDEFIGGFRWSQGEHVSLIGPTGGGKTTLGLALLPMRSYTVIYATKPRDRTLEPMAKRGGGWTRIKEWNPPGGVKRIILWPPAGNMATLRKTQQTAFHQANASIYSAGGWCVFADDLWYLCKVLGLSSDFETLWANGRAIGISLMCAVQRPAFVPLMAYDQATHLFFWQMRDAPALKRIGEIGGAVDSDAVKRIVQSLPRHDCLYVNSRSGAMLVTRAPGR